MTDLKVCVASATRILVGLTVTSVLASCDEALPPRDEPQQFLVTTAVVVDGSVSYRNGFLDGLGGTLLLSVRNAYSEVLEQKERLRGDVEIWMRDLPEKRASVHTDGRDLTDPSIMHNNLATLLPGMSAVMLRQWEHRVSGGPDSGRFFWEFVDSTMKFTQNGEPYWESDTVHFLAEARIQVFENVQAVRVRQIAFGVVYRRF
jgi:hypothetical protein